MHVCQAGQGCTVSLVVETLPAIPRPSGKALQKRY